MRCPICRKPSAERRADESGKSLYPFCSERCRLIDLGRWLDGVYQVPAAQDAPRGEESSGE